MILFDLTTQQVSGKGAESIREVRWSGNNCVVNNQKTAPVKTAELKGTLAEVEAKVAGLISNSGAQLFALLHKTKPFAIGGVYKTRVAYAEF